jgi:CBS domain-containing protein
MHQPYQFCHEIMRKDFIVATPNHTLSEALWIMQSTEIQWLPVGSEELALLGIISWVDILFHLPVFVSRKQIPMIAGSISGKNVGQVMTKNPITITPDETLEKLINILTSRHLVQNPSTSSTKSYISNIPVVQNNVLTGMVGYLDILRGIDSEKTLIQDVMTQGLVPTVRIDHSIQQAHYLMHEHGQRYVLVVDQSDRPIGVLSDTQVLRHIRALGSNVDLEVTSVMTDIRYYSPLDPSDSVRKAINILSNPYLGLRAFPVTMKNKFIGMISYLDILKAL